jgi:hypothetical protein
MLTAKWWYQGGNMDEQTRCPTDLASRKARISLLRGASIDLPQPVNRWGVYLELLQPDPPESKEKIVTSPEQVRRFNYCTILTNPDGTVLTFEGLMTYHFAWGMS